MGVFAIFRRRSKAAAPAAEKASATEDAATALTEDTESASGAEQETAGSTTADEQVREDEAGVADRVEATGDGAEIPKQQSAQEAADSEAAEGARK